MKEDKFAFIYSTRFWAYVVGAIAIAIGPDGIVTGPELHTALMSLVAAFAGTRFVDRTVDKLSQKESNTTFINGEI